MEGERRARTLKIGSGAGFGLMSFAMDHYHQPPALVAGAAFVGLVLILWEIGADTWMYLRCREGRAGVKMFITALVVIGCGALGVAGLLYLISTQPVEAQNTENKVPALPPSSSSGSSSNQHGGQTGGTIINNAPVYNGPVYGDHPTAPSIQPTNQPQPGFDIREKSSASIENNTLYGDPKNTILRTSGQGLACTRFG